MTKSLALLTGLGMLFASPVSFDTMDKILNVSENVFFKNAEVLITFEKNEKIGIAWFEMGGKPLAETYNFNYVRLDSTGNILVDMRNFMIKPAQLERYGIDWEESIPKLYYFSDDKGSAWLIYWSFGGIGWTQIDSNGRVIQEQSHIQSYPQTLVACSSEKLGFHLYWVSGGKIHYYNPELEAPLLTDIKVGYGKTGIELDDSRFLLVIPPLAFRRWIGPDSFAYRIIDDRGKVMKYGVLEWEKYVVTRWENIDLPETYASFKQDSVIYFVFTKDRSVNLITFTTDGEVIKPDRCIDGSVREIDRIPENAQQFMKIHKDTVYYFGFDDESNLYYCNNRHTKQ
jgi:hypothetical protein